MIRSILLILIVAVALTACGGAANSEKESSGNEVTPGVPNEEPPIVEPTQPAEPAEPAEPADQTKDGQPAETIQVELVVEGNVESRTGTLVISDNGYYLYTLPQFKFTPEEPNMDQVYMDNFEGFNMRIQTLGAEPDLDQERDNAELELAMLGEVIEMKGEEIGEPALRDSLFYLHSSDSTLSKYIILREIDGHYFKVTVNMPNSEAQEGAGPSFPAMIKTIQPLNQ